MEINGQKHIVPAYINLQEGDEAECNVGVGATTGELSLVTFSDE